MIPLAMTILKPPCSPPSLHFSSMRLLSKSGVPSLLIPRNINRPATWATSTSSARCKKERLSLMKPPAASTYPSLASSEPDHEAVITLTNEEEAAEEKFNWYAQWYPIMPLCDLDKRRPHGKKVMGLDVVVWWDRNDQEWRVFEDKCPHRLAPLSEGRIDQMGRLQCVYHGWCFGGSGDCKFIPQAPQNGPPVHTSRKACVAAYPSYVQNGILWFWPSTDPLYKNTALEKRPPYVAELDDPSYCKTGDFITRDLPYGYEVLIENLMDPSHAPYAHFTIMKKSHIRMANSRRIFQYCTARRADREGGRPLDISLEKLDINGYRTKQEFDGVDHQLGRHTFAPPCLLTSAMTLDRGGHHQSSSEQQKSYLLVFFCVPVSPGNSRLILSAPNNLDHWIDRITPRWISHLIVNLIIDSDLNLLYLEERKLMEAGPTNWFKSCYVPAKADANVVAFRRWLIKYSNGQVEFGDNYSNSLLPPTPPREQLLDRYWTHTVNCRVCSGAYRGLTALEMALQISSTILMGVAAASRKLPASRVVLVCAAAVACFVAGRCLARFTHKTFRYHDYDHAFVGASKSFLLTFFTHTGLT